MTAPVMLGLSVRLIVLVERNAHGSQVNCCSDIPSAMINSRDTGSLGQLCDSRDLDAENSAYLTETCTSTNQ